MKIQIKITKEVLRRSMWCDSACAPTNCAVAEAIRDLFSDAVVDVNHFITGGWTIWLPKEARAFIRKFDVLGLNKEYRLLMPEFSFEIDVPDEVIERIGIQEAKAILEKSETLSLVEA